MISEIQQKKNTENIQHSLTHNGATFYAEAIVNNPSGNKANITIGNNTHVRGMLNVFAYGGEISIGENCYIGDYSRIWSGEKITIGNDVLISHNVNIIDTNSHETDAIERSERYMDLLKNGHWRDKGSILTAPIIIKDYVWISFNATILKGVTIGEGAIVAANAVVVKDVPDYTLVVGNPAMVIKNLKA